jgi:hypothetical protein
MMQDRLCPVKRVLMLRLNISHIRGRQAQKVPGQVNPVRHQELHMTFIGRVRHIRLGFQVDEGGEGGRFLRRDHLFHTPVSHQAMMILAILGSGTFTNDVS